MVAAARAAQPAWEALGFEGRAEVLLAARRWMVANGERVVDTIVRRDRPARRRDPVRRALLRALGARVLGQARRRATSPTRRSSPRRRSSAAAGSSVRYAPLGVVGVIGPWNYPLNQLVRRLHPGARRRQRGGPEALGGHPADLAADGRDARRVRDPRGRLPGRHRARRDRRGAGRRGRLRDVHRLGRDRQEGDGAGGRDADPGQPRARRQGPDDRARRRRPRAGRERRGLLRAQQLGPGLHLGRADLRRGAGPRRVPRAADREGRGAAPGPAGRARARSTSARSSSRRRSS